MSSRAPCWLRAWVLALLLPTCAAVGQTPGPTSTAGPVPASSPTATRPFGSPAAMETAFKEAYDRTGPEYLEAERRLLSLGQAATPGLLQQSQSHPDPLGRLLAQVMLQWSDGTKAADYEAALKYLEGLPVRAARTPMGKPSPMGLASYLTLHFKDRVVDLLALRLLKEGDWPHWKVAGVLLYLEQQRQPVATEALLRFAADTQNEEWRGYAVQALQKIRDPALPAKLSAEQQRLVSQRRAIPQALLQLGAGAPPKAGKE